MLHPTVPLGIYEKALPADEEWPQRLTQAAQLGFDFVEMSIDESDRRLARLSWSRQQRLELLAAMAHSGVRIPSLCLSAHRRFPLGSEDQEVRRQALRLLAHAITLAQDLGIRVIQLAGYDVYYQQGNPLTRQLFREGLSQAVTLASRAQVTLAMETMDTPLLNSISKALGYCRYLRSPGSRSTRISAIFRPGIMMSNWSWRQPSTTSSPYMSKTPGRASFGMCPSAAAWSTLRPASARWIAMATAVPT